MPRISKQEIQTISNIIKKHYAKVIKEAKDKDQAQEVIEFMKERDDILSNFQSSCGLVYELHKQLGAEVKSIEQDNKVSEWDYVDVEKMNSNDAYTRGFYRAFNNILNLFKKNGEQK